MIYLSQNCNKQLNISEILIKTCCTVETKDSKEEKISKWFSSESHKWSWWFFAFFSNAFYSSGFSTTIFQSNTFSIFSLDDGYNSEYGPTTIKRKTVNAAIGLSIL